MTTPDTTIMSRIADSYANNNVLVSLERPKTFRQSIKDKEESTTHVTVLRKLFHKTTAPNIHGVLSAFNAVRSHYTRTSCAWEGAERGVRVIPRARWGAFMDAHAALQRDLVERVEALSLHEATFELECFASSRESKVLLENYPTLEDFKDSLVLELTVRPVPSMASLAGMLDEDAMARALISCMKDIQAMHEHHAEAARDTLSRLVNATKGTSKGVFEDADTAIETLIDVIKASDLDTGGLMIDTLKVTQGHLNKLKQDDGLARLKRGDDTAASLVATAMATVEKVAAATAPPYTDLAGGVDVVSYW
jgi:hypothetical protein